MAMAANTIVAENLTLTGSIGVVTGDLTFVYLPKRKLYDLNLCTIISFTLAMLNCFCLFLLLQQDLPWPNYMKRLASTRKLYLEENMLSFWALRKDLLSE